MRKDTVLGLIALLVLLMALVVVPMYWIKRKILQLRKIFMSDININNGKIEFFENSTASLLNQKSSISFPVFFG